MCVPRPGAKVPRGECSNIQTFAVAIQDNEHDTVSRPADTAQETSPVNQGKICPFNVPTHLRSHI